jgi:hypothetical protein
MVPSFTSTELSGEHYVTRIVLLSKTLNKAFD